MTVSTDQVWRTESVIERYLAGVRGGIPLAAVQLREIVRLVGAAVGTPDRFLDLGCGDGVLGRALLDSWPQARGVFLDFAAPMIEACRERLGSDAERHLLRLSDYGHPDWIAGVSEFAPFPVVVSGFSIHHQEDARKRSLYREIFELLAPGGLFLNLEHVASASTWGETIFDACFLDSLGEFHRHAGTGRLRAEIESEYYRRPDKAANRLARVETQCDWLREIGFEHVDCFLKIYELALFGGLKPGMIGRP